MTKQKLVSAVFYLSGFYDGLLGLIFLIMGPRLFEVFKVTPPNHWGYIQFPAAMLMIFGTMFLAVARKPLENRNLIPYGILLKLAYCVVVFAYWFTSGIPGMWKPFAVIDALFAAGFYWAWVALKRQ